MNKFLILFLFALLCACAETPLELGAHQVIVSIDPPEKGCKFVSQVMGYEPRLTFPEQQKKGAINIIRNESYKLGANYVRLINNRSSTYVGNAYKCPDND